MSGGHFDYEQHKFMQIAGDLEEYLASRRNEQSEQLNEEMELGIFLCKIAYVYAQRLDWLISGDDGEETFFNRLFDDLTELLKTAPPRFEASEILGD